jgi:hypothetical protein
MPGKRRRQKAPATSGSLWSLWLRGDSIVALFVRAGQYPGREKVNLPFVKGEFGGVSDDKQCFAV